MTDEREKALRREAVQAAIAHYRHAHGQERTFRPGDRINYGGRFFDEREVASLIEASLDFWLTTGRFADRFEAEFASYLGVSHCSLVNSGSSANLLAFMALTS